MKTKLLTLLFFVVSSFSAFAQESAVYDYFNNGIDELVAAASNVNADYEEEKTNHVYSKMFATPVLYESVLGKAFACEESEESDSELLSMDDKRSAVIDELMLNVYSEYPTRVVMTEEELRNEQTHSDIDTETRKPMLDLSNTIAIPEDVVGGMPTTVVKPNYWKFAGRTSLTFTQNFISPNWFQGGESNYAMLATIDLDMNYDNKDRITWTNHFDYDLGFATYPSDAYHTFKTNTDKLRIESTFGCKLVKNLDIAAKVKVETQSLPNYPSNEKDFISNFAAPLDANASVGLNYKPSIGNFKIEVFLAPLSAYNFRFVCYRNLARDRFGFNEKEVSRCFRQDYGTQLVVTIPTYKISSFLDVYSRLEYYTNYERVFFQWETKFNATLSKYFTASLMLHSRFDDSVILSTEEATKKWGFWQLKELFTLGVAYSW